MSEPHLRDLFSSQAAEYARFRPDYPLALLEALLDLVPERDKAWDCATGNGQVALALAPYFRSIEATDISAQQIAQAVSCANVHYSLAEAEKAPFEDHCFDLITVAQAAHWFDLPAFYTEAARVMKPGGILAIWGYNLPRIRPDIDALIDHFYTHIVGPYWDMARQWVSSEYRELYFPFPQIDMPDFEIRKTFTSDSLAGYLGSWSALQKFRTERGFDPLPRLQQELEAIWGRDEELKGIFPIFMKVARL